MCLDNSSFNQHNLPDSIIDPLYIVNVEIKRDKKVSLK